MDNFAELLSQYDYDYPADAVALVPAEPRDAARLLVYDATTDQSTSARYADICDYLPPQSCLIFNETKVIPARVEATKSTGGRVRLLYIKTVGPASFEALADRKMEPSSLVLAHGKEIRIDSLIDGKYSMTLTDSTSPLDFFLAHGQMPLPPYLKSTPLQEQTLRERYQTVFAKHTGSVAAPTASLHFTPELLDKIRSAGHEIHFVTLHVNIGTFLPLRAEQVQANRLHQEEYLIPAETSAAIRRAKDAGRPVIAVGTTVVRTLESSDLLTVDAQSDITGQTTLFIRPGYEFSVIDGLITNFHVPQSSLLMLVAALIGREKLFELYAQAIADGFRIFSFGDGMLLLPKHPLD
ncbi:MAG: tRNA preQ1(34) S-adenosylmethionine ribosyltransferase-isomerase QueA [Patescibacteria group bacterium]